MAAATVLPEPAIVDILSLVTCTTDGRGLVGIRPRGMTGITGQPLVGPQKRVAGELLVIELPEIPGIGRMAGVAIFPQRAFVVVILFMAADAVGAGAGKLVADVAALAGHGTVQAHQREIGEVVIEAIDDFPAVGDVAGGAHLHFRILVDIVRRVAGSAVARQIVLQCADVAIGAGEGPVVSGERKTGLARVIECRLFPAGSGVAGLTLGAVAPQMYVAVGVAAVAGHGRIFLDHTVGMAGAAGQFRVLMTQGEIRAVVIENPLVPAVHRVAGFTLFAVFPGVHVGRLVATHAGSLFKLIALASVASAAGHLAVQPLKLESCRRMIELLAFLPPLRRVAATAFRAERALVKVVLLVATGALGFGVAKFLALFMATGTGQG